MGAQGRAFRNWLTRVFGRARVIAVGMSAGMCAGAAEQPAAAGAVVELPKFEVTDSRLLPQPEKWLYAEIPGYEILSNLSGANTRRFVQDFLLLQSAMSVLMPGLRAGPVAVPTSLILTGKRNAFEQFIPPDRGDDRFRTNSYFFQDAERGAIVVDFQLAELQLEDNTTIETDAYRSFYKEFFRYLIRRNVARKPPPWFEEGLVQMFAGIDFNRKWVSFAMVGDGFGGERTGDFNRILAQRALMPFPDMLAEQPTRTGAFWSAQCYAFVHMCLYGRGQKYQRPFLKFITRLENEPLSPQLFQECFGMDYKKMAIELRGYVDFTDYKYIQFAAKKGQSLPAPPPFELTDAPDAVVGRLKGEALRLAGRGNDARTALIAPYIRGERDPRLLAALGLDEKQAGQDERAMKFLEAAAAAKVERARAYLELARLRLAKAKAKPLAPEGRLNDAQVVEVLTPLFTARQQPPPMAAVYTTIAEVWLAAAVPPQREHLEVVLEGVRAFPRDTALLMQATLLAARRGFVDEARRLAERGTKLATDPGERDTFTVLLGTLTRDDAAKVPAPAAENEAKPAITPGPYFPKSSP